MNSKISKEIAYYKSIRGRSDGMITQYHALRDDGSIKTVDEARAVVRFNSSFGSKPYSLEKSTKKLFEKIYLKTINK